MPEYVIRVTGSFRTQCFVFVSFTSVADSLQVEIDNLKEAAHEQEVVMEAQGSAIDERQSDVESMTKEVVEKDKKLKKMEGQINRLKLKNQELEKEFAKKDAELDKASEGKEDILKAMREAYEVTKAKKAEYEARLTVVQEQVRGAVSSVRRVICVKLYT